MRCAGVAGRPGRAGKGALLSALVLAEKIERIDDRLGKKDHTPGSGSQRVKRQKGVAKRWTRIDDGVLSSLVDFHGEGNWEAVAAAMRDRTADAVEQHWLGMKGARTPRKQGGRKIGGAEVGEAAAPAQTFPDEGDFSDGDDEAPFAAPVDDATRRARLAFLASDEAATAASGAPLAPIWLAPECIRISATLAAGDGNPIYATTLMSSNEAASWRPS